MVELLNVYLKYQIIWLWESYGNGFCLTVTSNESDDERTIKSIWGTICYDTGIACGNGLEHVDTDLKFTKEFTKIADKNMPRYAKICQDKAKIKKGKKAWKARK